MNTTKLLDSTFGKWTIAIIPGIIAYISFTKDIKNLIKNINMDQYIPLMAFLIVWVMAYFIISRLSIQKDMKLDIQKIKASLYDIDKQVKELNYINNKSNQMLASIIDYNISIKRIESLPYDLIKEKFTISDLKRIGIPEEDIKRVFPNYKP